MIKTLPVQPRRQGNYCALDAARRNSRKLAKKFQTKKLQAQEWCSESFSEFALDCVFT
jgi:hypothetical protein